MDLGNLEEVGALDPEQGERLELVCEVRGWGWRVRRFGEGVWGYFFGRGF